VTITAFNSIWVFNFSQKFKNFWIEVIKNRIIKASQDSSLKAGYLRNKKALLLEYKAGPLSFIHPPRFKVRGKKKRDINWIE
jgi:hypothetical protein